MRVNLQKRKTCQLKSVNLNMRVKKTKQKTNQQPKMVTQKTQNKQQSTTREND